MRLTTSRHELVHRGALLLEDALRTASLPDDGRAVFVRSLSLGRMTARVSRTEVARRVECGVGDLLARAVHGLHPSAPGSDTVYFRDAVESYAALAAYVATQRPTDAWFWQLVDPHWRPSLSRDESLRALLRSAFDTPAGVVAAAEMVRQVERSGALDALLTALRWQDGPPLLAASGWSAAATGSRDVGAPPRAARPHPRALSASGQHALARWGRHWGASDARSIWLAGVLLVAERPIRAMDSSLPAVMRALVAHAAGETREESLTHGASRRTDRDVRESAPEMRGPDSQPADMTKSPRPMGEARPLRTGAGERTSVSEEVPATIEEAASTAATHQAPTRVPSDGISAMARDEVVDHGPPAPPASLTRAASEGAKPPATEPDSDVPVQLDHTVDGEVSAPTSPWCDASNASVTATPLPAGSTHEDDPPSHRDVSPAPWAFRAMDDEHPTAYGGYFFLIPLLTRLHMSEFLDAHPALVDWDLPVRVLARLDRRLGLDERDAALSILTRHPASEPVGWNGVMTVPEPWAPFAASVGRGAGRPQRSGAELVLASWIAVMRRWCRAHTGVGLRTLVSRPARLASTRTHIDVYFTLSQVDMRVRLAGLDVNPGWVPWLGRVVQFHYRPSGASDGN